jgi:esterase/lipase superfamily enzyme
MGKDAGRAPRKGGSTIFYATNRDRLGDGFDLICCPDPRHLWLGRVEVEMLGDPDATEAPRDLLGVPETSGIDDFGDATAGPCAKLLDDWLATAAAANAVALLFIHGFSNSFGSAAQRAAQLAEFYAAEGVALVPLTFSWPSDGRVISADPGGRLVDGALRQYKLDQEDAAAAGPALARLLAEIRRARARQAPDAAKAARLGLLAHSMGNHALANGLLALDNGLMTRDMRGLFGDAALVAADVSAAALAPGKSLRLVADLAERVTVGISYDNVLRMASETANQNRRLGHSGPDDLSVLPANIEVVDYYPGLDPTTKDRVLAAGGTEYDVVQHQWYRNDIAARADLALALSGRKPKRRKALPPDKQTDTGRTRHAFLS